MTAEAPPPLPVYRPIEARRAGLPAWVLVLAALLAVGAALYLFTNLTPPPAPGQAAGPGASAPPGTSPTQGEPVDVAAAQALLEEAGCQACHGEDLGGQATFPSLHGVAEGPVSDNLQQLGADRPEDWANLWIAGDAPEVQGLDRRGMPTFAEQLTEEEIEQIVEYLKSL